MEYPVAEGMVEHARRWLVTPPAERRPAPARPSATVVLLRDGADGLECYLQHRPKTMKFAAGMAAFPGGSMEPHDGELTVTALRELFEETGVLLADPVGPVPDPEQMEAARAGVEAGAGLAEATAGLGVRLRPDLLIWWMRRITPEFNRHRYDTTFFLAAVRPGDDPRPLTTESEDGSWANCRQTLTDGTPLMQPTRAALTSLGAYSRLAEVVVAERDRTPVMTRLVEGSDPPMLTTDPEESA